MKVTVKKDFADKYKPWISHKIGEVMDIPADRAKDLIGRGLVTAPEAAKAPDEEQTVPKTVKRGNKNVGKGKKSVKNND